MKGKMMYERTFRPALVLLLALGSSIAVKTGLEDELAEDESFWGRVLQASSSLPTVLVPELPPVVPPTAAPVLPPTQPCGLRITISCEVGEGIECNEFIPTAACGLITQTFVYTFQNVGATPFSINSYSLARTDQPTTTVPFSASLGLGGTARAVENFTFNSCVPSVTAVSAVGNPGACQATTFFSYTTGTRRVTKGTAVAMTVPEINAKKEVGVAVVNEILARHRRRTKYTRGGARTE